MNKNTKVKNNQLENLEAVKAALPLLKILLNNKKNPI